MKFRAFFGAALLVATVSMPAIADDDPAIGQRQGQFKLFVHNFGALGSMVQGRIDYDADLAATAAQNLYHVSRHDQGRLWPEGTGSNNADGTRARPEIWENLDDFMQKFVDMQDAVEALQPVAGDGLDALRPVFGAVAGTCQACHETYREESS